MAATQIVSAWRGSDELRQSLGKLPTGKIVFLTPPEHLRETLAVRNDFAIAHKMPTEVKILEKDVGRLCSVITSYPAPVLHLIDHSPLNYYLISASIILGVKVYVSNGAGMEQVMTVPVRLREFLNTTQIKLMEFLSKRPLTLAEAAKNLNTKPGVLSFYIRGNNSMKGLTTLGLIEEKDDKLWLTEFGKSVINC